MTDKAPPTKEVLEFIRWAINAAESEFYLPADDRADLNASLKWLEQFSSSPCDSEAE